LPLSLAIADASLVDELGLVVELDEAVEDGDDGDIVLALELEVSVLGDVDVAADDEGEGEVVVDDDEELVGGVAGVIVVDDELLVAGGVEEVAGTVVSLFCVQPTSAKTAAAAAEIRNRFINYSLWEVRGHSACH
jgi:hypothetical protein